MMGQQYGNGDNNDNQAPLIGNATVRQTPFGTTEFKIGISPDGMQILNQAANGGWANAILFQAKSEKWFVKLDTWKPKQNQHEGHRREQSRQSSQEPTRKDPAAYYNQDKFQPKRPPQAQSLGSVSQSVANNMRPPQPVLNHTAEKTYDDHGEEIPF